MIKRLAHRNANVQLYTLEVGHMLPGPADQSSDGSSSWQMRYHRIVDRRCTGSLLQGASLMPYYDWQMTGCVAASCKTGRSEAQR